MKLIPSIEILKERYKDIMDNQDITALSCWKEPNFDEPCDDEEYLQRGLDNADAMSKLFEEALLLI
ncbi:MAG: hypothetical protein HQK63_06335 [Desulfamplus sp.]|nr:hypothetical protein [Desulfamplus sp.]